MWDTAEQEEYFTVELWENIHIDLREYRHLGVKIRDNELEQESEEKEV